MAKAGKVANKTKVNVHPIIKAKIRPAIKLAATMKIVEIFSPIAPWKANVSVENLEEI